MNEIIDIFTYKPTPEELTAKFIQLMSELEESPVELAKRMAELGDHRSFSTILRSIQRMLSGDSGVSGEMFVIVKMLVRQQRQRVARFKGVKWDRFSNGVISAKVGEFVISLIPQTRGRWLVSMVHKDGYSPAWPNWQNNLEAAKKKAFTCLSDAEVFLEEIAHEEEAGRSASA